MGLAPSFSCFRALIGGALIAAREEVVGSAAALLVAAEFVVDHAVGECVVLSGKEVIFGSVLRITLLLQ